MPVTETAPYPSELEADIVLTNRRRVRIRPLRRCEEESLREAVRSPEPSDWYLRFFSEAPTLPDSTVRMLACVDYRRQLALVAEHDNGNGREDPGWLVLERSTTAESNWGSSFETTGSDSGSAPSSPTACWGPAEARGFHQFIANVSSDNVAIRKLLKRSARSFERRGCGRGIPRVPVFVRCRTK